MALLAIRPVDHSTTFDITTIADTVLSGLLIYHQCLALAEKEDGLRIAERGHVLAGELAIWTMVRHLAMLMCFTRGK